MPQTDYANNHDTGRRLTSETAVRLNPLLRRAAERAQVGRPPKTPAFSAAVVALLMESARLAGSALGRSLFAHEWAQGTTPAGLELGRFKSAAVRLAERQLVGVRVGPDGDVDALPVEPFDPADPTAAHGSVAAAVDRAFFRQKVRPLGCRAAVPTVRPARLPNRRHPMRVPAPMLGPALGVDPPAA